MPSHTMRQVCGQRQNLGRIQTIASMIVLVLSPQILRAQASRLPQIPPGTIVGASDSSRWNAVVLLARPTISSGDRDMIPESISKLVPTFVLTILATVEAYAPVDAPSRKFRLKEVGVGFSTEVDGELKIVTPEAATKVGANLGFIQKRMLSTNQEQLAKTKIVARTSTLLIFDVPTIMFREGKHKDFVTRHFIWIDSSKGSNAALVWLLKESSSGKMVAFDEPMRLVPRGTRENRKTHVDRSEFMLGGIPTERSFALEDLPPGRLVPWTMETKYLAALPTYTEEQLRNLTESLSKALQATSK